MKQAVFDYALALVLAPLLPGVINRIKAWFGGRRGRPLLQAYFDIYKLLRKGAVYSRTTTWVFRAGPVLGLSSMLCALMLIPFGASRSIMLFTGDLFLFAGLLTIGRFFTMAAAMDTGSSFEGMGASREAFFAALAEPVLILTLFVLARHSESLTLSTMLVSISPKSWMNAAPVLILVTAALFILLLLECSRIPFDDPNTHLELTMIHEVMVLDHSGPDLAFIQYAAALKLWIFGSLIMSVLGSVAAKGQLVGMPVQLLIMFLLAVAVGIVEPIMARMRLVRVPQFLAMAGMFSFIGLIMFEV
jgi:formate hydrogenlyase subunit 4